MKAVIAAVDRFNHFVHSLLGVLFGLAALLMLAQVAARYLFKSPLVWSEEIIRYVIIWVVFLCGAIALRKGQLISVEIVQHLVPPIVRKGMGIAVTLLNAVMMVILLRYGIMIMQTLQGQTIGALELPVSLIYAVIPLSAGYSLINCAVVLYEQIFIGKEESHDGPAIL